MSAKAKKAPPKKSTTLWDKTRKFITSRKWTLLAIAIFAVATISFLWPMATHLTSYSEGGDHMFNAWTLARDHHCILRQNCANYNNANIFFPHKDSMLYSETQISAGLLTLPFYLINHNPLFAVNIWYVLSAFFSGLFMYFLAKYLSKGNEPISILAGLVYEFAPAKITAMSHLQNLSIFYVPLIILLLLKFRDTGKKSYLVFFGIACSLLFLASWYQMVFGLITIGLFIVFVFFKSRPKAVWLALATILAIMTTLPIAKEYIRFSKANKAGFSLASQVQFSNSIDDYFLPEQETPAGTLYYKLRPAIQRNSHNPDNYAYAGVTLYTILLICLILVLRKKSARFKDDKMLVIMLCVLFSVGVVMSLGPFIKIGSQSIFRAEGMNVVIPAPYILVDKFLPQLSFMRAIGRASVIALFALCCLLAIFGSWLNDVRPPKKRYLLSTIVFIFIAVDLLPVKLLLTSPWRTVEPYKTHFAVPSVYTKIRDNSAIDNLVVLRADKDYSYAGIPIAPAEDVLWTGYDNKNLFNGYSGYEPADYRATLADFTDLHTDDVPKMKRLGIHFVLIDKQLSTSNPELIDTAQRTFSKQIYEDNRYTLFAL